MQHTHQPSRQGRYCATCFDQLDGWKNENELHRDIKTVFDSLFPDREKRSKKLSPNRHALMVHHQNNQGNSKLGADSAALGVREGVPDLQVFHQGGSFFIELKTETGRVSPAQVLRIAQLKDWGFKVYLARSIREMLAILVFELKEVDGLKKVFSPVSIIKIIRL